MVYGEYDGVYIKVTEYYDNVLQSFITIVTRRKSMICKH